MTTQSPEQATGTTIALPELFDLNATDAVRESLVAAFDEGNVVIDGAPVSRVATNGLFLLMSARKTAKEQGHELTISDPSPAIVDAVECLGLESEFKGWMTE